MSSLPVGTIVFEQVSKRYRLGTLGNLRGTAAALVRRAGSNDGSRDFWALKDVSFRVEPGDSLGLIGPNGAGKTTTLKLLSNITQPTTGSIALSGRFSSLIELGAGFHPELTGRENIFLNGAILGLSQREIQRKLDEIIAFSELERFIDTPVKRYSSGMYVRLGFAVAAHVEPDVLLVDEVLAVGDSSFRHRCINHMRALQQNGTTVVFVSHNMHLVRSMCKMALLLIGGQIHFEGLTPAVISAYERWLTESPATDKAHASVQAIHSGLMLKAMDVLPVVPPPSPGLFDSRQPVKLQIHYHAIEPQRIGRIDVRILRDDSILCCTADSSQSANGALVDLVGEGVVELVYSPLQLTSGTYTAVAQVTDVSDSVVIASVQSAPFNVYAEGAARDRGVYVPEVTWCKTP
ncbi:MAG: ATP-binding cassette domain-containing protein [Anaerolineae bacterium]|nr:ATP-binding cassette domain-containing protein [Anaerolineae bacterium]